MQKIVGVKRFGDKDTYFFLQNIEDLELNDRVVVQFDEYETVAMVTKLGCKAEDVKAYELKCLTRKATEKDIQKFEELTKKAKSKLPEIKRKSLELGLMMKFISAEYCFNESKVLMSFSSEERVDFRGLLKELATMFKTRIELKQVGQRDEVKICGGVGPCGEQCCCARFLKNFDHVTVKMAKVQGLSLAPTKINGICGRLMCCLGYESDMYEEILSKMPKLGTTIKTPNGSGTVVYNDILRERVSVKRQADGDTYIVEDFSLEDINDVKNGSYEAKKAQRLAEENKQVQEDNKPNINKDNENLNSKSNGEKQNYQNNKKEDKREFKNKHNGQNNTSKKESFGMEIVDASSVQSGENKQGNSSNFNGKEHKNFNHRKFRHKNNKFNGKPDLNKK